MAAAKQARGAESECVRFAVDGCRHIGRHHDENAWAAHVIRWPHSDAGISAATVKERPSRNFRDAAGAVGSATAGHFGSAWVRYLFRIDRPSVQSGKPETPILSAYMPKNLRPSTAQPTGTDARAAATARSRATRLPGHTSWKSARPGCKPEAFRYRSERTDENRLLDRAGLAPRQCRHRGEGLRDDDQGDGNARDRPRSGR
jgi:hypothetical protein